MQAKLLIWPHFILLLLEAVTAGMSDIQLKTNGFIFCSVHFHLSQFPEPGAQWKVQVQRPRV